jgi:FAD-dependent oxidoreductase domain-containing protein 1
VHLARERWGAGNTGGTAVRDRYDVVVVGAGAFGLASAYHLIERRPDLTILVVEARSGPGEGSMGASAAMVRDVFTSEDNHRLAKNAIAFYRRIMEEHEALRSPAPLLDLYGYLWLLPETHLAEYASLIAERRGSIDAQVLDAEELRSCPGLDLAPRRWYEGDGAPPPAPIVGGLFGRTCGAVAPEMLANFYWEEARRRGVEFLFDTTVQRLSFEGREEILLHEPSKMPFSFQDQVKGRLRIARVVFGNGRYVGADSVVVAGGAWSEKLLHPLGFATACSPRPQLQFSVSGPGVEELLAWQPPVQPVDPARGRSRFPFLILPTGATLKPIFPQRQMWIGCVDSVAHPIGTREDPARDGRLDYDMGRLGDRDAFATDVLPAVTPYLPRFESNEVRMENAWGGYYNFSPDGLPVLTEEPYGVIFVSGDSGSGIMKADSMGRLVAARYEGKSEATLFTGDSYRPDRLSLHHRVLQEERFIL